MSAGVLRLAHGDLATPAFLPDATYGVVRAVDAEDLERCGVPAVVMSTFHLMQHPGSSTVRALGGLHRLTGWRGPIVTDSGGFQAYSLVRQNPRQGALTSKGIAFQPEGAKRPFQLTPEKTVQLQVAYGADVVVCLDDCRHPDEPESEQAISVARTIDWARRGKAEFERLMAQPRRDKGRPLLFAVVQGGASRELRRRCADELLSIGFDGFGYGGWPLSGSGELLIEMLAYTRELIPSELPLHALGVGHPESVARCAALGYDLFDSALPTRDARHGRLYALDGAIRPDASGWLDYVYVQDERHSKAVGPVYPGCPCFVCARYPLAYLRHLFKTGDVLFQRLATAHNLAFMAGLMAALRG
ncbi:MAG TPA: tRNA guanosine(34) transglycosylase Tgt [Chloroflexota bacterium]